MKKKYMTPAIEIVKVEKPSILAGSITQRSDYLDVNITGDGEFGDGETIN